VSYVLSLDVQLLGRLVLIGEIHAASDSLLQLLFLALSLFELLDCENLDDALGIGWLFFDLLFLCGAIEDCLSLWLVKECLLLWSQGHVHVVLLSNLIELVDVESINLLGLQWGSVELDLKDRVRDGAVNTERLKMLLKFKEQINMVASGEE